MVCFPRRRFPSRRETRTLRVFPACARRHDPEHALGQRGDAIRGESGFAAEIRRKRQFLRPEGDVGRRLHDLAALEDLLEENFPDGRIHPGRDDLFPPRSDGSRILVADPGQDIVDEAAAVPKAAAPGGEAPSRHGDAPQMAPARRAVGFAVDVSQNPAAAAAAPVVAGEGRVETAAAPVRPARRPLRPPEQPSRGGTRSVGVALGDAIVSPEGIGNRPGNPRSGSGGRRTIGRRAENRPSRGAVGHRPPASLRGIDAARRSEGAK